MRQNGLQTVYRGWKKVLGFMQAMLAAVPPSSLWGMYLTKVLSLVTTWNSPESSPLNYKTHNGTHNINLSSRTTSADPGAISPTAFWQSQRVFYLVVRGQITDFESCKKLRKLYRYEKCSEVAQWELEDELDTYYCGATPPDRRNGHGHTPGAGKAGPLTRSAVLSCASFPNSF
jgi:hypothetical protein